MPHPITYIGVCVSVRVFVCVVCDRIVEMVPDIHLDILIECTH